MNGSTQERRLLAVLRDLGFAVMRSPGSGTGDWDQPDIIAARDTVPIVIELRAGATPKNLNPTKVDALRRVGDAFWAAALVGIRYKGDRTFYLVQPGNLDRTDSGKYALPNAADDCPWIIALPYQKSDDGVTANPPLFWKDRSGMGGESLIDILDLIVAEQQKIPVDDRRLGDTDG